MDKIKPEVFSAAMRLDTFLDQFLKMTEEERKACIERVDSKNAWGLVVLHTKLSEYLSNE